MKYGIREICDVVFRAKAVTKVGNRIFYKDEPIMYFDTLKTSSLEAAASSVYAQGGRGNPRLVAWDGDRTLTFNMEDALISSEGLQILSGAGLLEASTNDPIKVHTTSQLSGSEVIVNTNSGSEKVEVVLPELPYWNTLAAAQTGKTTTAVGVTLGVQYNATLGKYEYTKKIENQYYYYPENYIYVMVLDEYGEVRTEPFIPDITKGIQPVKWDATANSGKGAYVDVSAGDEALIEGYKVTLYTDDDIFNTPYETNSESSDYGKKKSATKPDHRTVDSSDTVTGVAPVFGDVVRDIFKGGGLDTVLVDYYVEKLMNTQQVEITADKFGGTYYIEGSTLFRTQQGIDMPAEFVIPNGKIQSNFTFSMAATGDPSTFTFTVDAMPDYTRFDKTKKVLAAIQIVQDGAVTDADRERTYTFGSGVDVANL